MASPLQLFDSAARFVTASANIDPGSKTKTAESQAAHLMQVLGSMSFDQDQATELLNSLAVDKVFTATQRTSISSIVREVVQSGSSLASLAVRSFAKEQEHLYVYDWMPARLWHIINSNDDIMNKMRHVAQWAVADLQLRNPSAMTLRLFVSTLHVAGKIPENPELAYTHVRELSAKFKNAREHTKGDQSLSKFPATPESFVLRFPHAYHPDHPAVPCVLNLDDIKELASKSSIPVRNTNSRIAKPRTADVCGPSTQPQSHDMSSMVQLMGDYLLSRGNAPNKAIDVIPDLKIFEQSTKNTKLPHAVTGHQATPLVLRCLATPSTLDSLGNLED